MIRGVGEIHLIEDTIDAEDLHLHKESGLLFTACQGVRDSRLRWFPPACRFEHPEWAEKAEGGLRVIDPKTFKATRLELVGFTGAFVTHGIDIISDPADPQCAVFIHAVNHLPNPEYTPSSKLIPKAASQVEIFHHTIGSTSARHIASVAHPLIQTPNDILSTSPYSFYVTNDHHYREGRMRTVEVLGTQAFCAWSTTVHVEVRIVKGKLDSVEATTAVEGLHNNNGLGYGSNRSEVIICDASAGRTHLANIADDYRLKVYNSIDYTSTIDNPTWFEDPYSEATGRDASGIVCAGLVQAWKLAAEIDTGPAASLVWLTTPVPGKKNKWRKKLIFQDDGTLIRSATTALLLAIDPKENDGKKQAWLWITGCLSARMLVVKVNI
ncbi:hypothetical protein BCR39DRAFT_472569 [Naematelia encephala]|uniref:Serum paraoxonase/arylesterase n=1 Tax=Naematelia encephala TaxID=71784 RepID=A0A1Y2ANT0_9TREE|nr:hypothetical protein BCR39DRAFT_472569 [Naematelia encephala]